MLSRHCCVIVMSLLRHCFVVNFATRHRYLILMSRWCLPYITGALRFRDRSLVVAWLWFHPCVMGRLCWCHRWVIVSRPLSMCFFITRSMPRHDLACETVIRVVLSVAVGTQRTTTNTLRTLPVCVECCYLVFNAPERHHMFSIRMYLYKMFHMLRHSRSAYLLVACETFCTNSIIGVAYFAKPTTMFGNVQGWFMEFPRVIR